MKYRNMYILTILGPKSDPLPPNPGYESQNIIIFFNFKIVPYILYCLKVIFGGLIRFIGDNFDEEPKYLYFDDFGSKCDRPSQVMICKKIIIFFTLAIVSYILCCLKVIFWWFGRFYCGETLMKYLNTYILTIFLNFRHF